MAAITPTTVVLEVVLEGHVGPPTHTTVLKIVDWANLEVNAQIDGESFSVWKQNDNRATKEPILYYRAWDGTPSLASVRGNEFLIRTQQVVSPISERVLKFKTWNGQNCSARIVGLAGSPHQQPQQRINSRDLTASMGSLSMNHPAYPYPQQFPVASSSMVQSQQYQPGPQPIWPYATNNPASLSSSQQQQQMAVPLNAPVLHSTLRFKQTKQLAETGHEDINLHYKSWDGSNWTARLANGTFYVTLSGTSSGMFDTIVNYKAWDGSNWTARLTSAPDGLPAFYLVPQNGHSGKVDKALTYRAWDDSCWTATLVPDPALVAFLPEESAIRSVLQRH